MSVRLISRHFPLALPGFLNLNGSTDFTGRLTGTPESPQLEGHLQLKQFAVNQLMFEPQLAGAVTFSPQRGVVLNLAGDRDKILLNLDRDFSAPTNFPANQRGSA